MTFENFSRLSGAKLINTPSISGFENIETNPKKIKRGDLFIGNIKEDIELALNKEAYGIVTEVPYTILDSEIAWFQAYSLQEILIKLLRFKLLEQTFYFIYTNNINKQLIEKIADKEVLYTLGSDEKENFKTIINAPEKSFIFSSDKTLLAKIYPEYQTLENRNTPLFKHIHTSLFLTHFTHHTKQYKNIKIPSLFIKYLETVVTFLEQHHISFDLEKCHFTSELHPIFIDKALRIKPFGKSDRVLICSEDQTTLATKVEYLQKHTPWAKHLLLLEESYTITTPLHIDIMRYKNLEDLNELKNIEFNFAIIVTSFEKLINILEKKEQKEQFLFFQGE
ncbi:MAG: hypothetical protein K0U47_10140 [Epsilonproteobacteria bacterium]|nr:hypothetical protein [Campylobacterota bacterium]